MTTATSSQNGVVKVDPQELTLAEYGEIEDLFGVSLEQMLEGVGEWKAIAAMAWLLRRREDPTYTYEQASTLRMRDLELVTPDEPDPTVGAPDGVPPVSSPDAGTSTLSE